MEKRMRKKDGTDTARNHTKHEVTQAANGGLLDISTSTREMTSTMDRWRIREIPTRFAPFAPLGSLRGTVSVHIILEPAFAQGFPG